VNLYSGDRMNSTQPKGVCTQCLKVRVSQEHTDDSENNAMNESEIWQAIRGKRKPVKKRSALKSRATVRKKKARKIVPARGKTSWGRIYPDLREVCDDETAAGKAEYKRRTLEMAERQNWICGCGCGQGMFKAPGYRYSATFDHSAGRGFNGGHRDDRIWIDGNPYNSAMTYACNMKKSSVRA
jgi:hypothetical protein